LVSAVIGAAVGIPVVLVFNSFYVLVLFWAFAIISFVMPFALACMVKFPADDCYVVKTEAGIAVAAILKELVGSVPEENLDNAGNLHQITSISSGISNRDEATTKLAGAFLIEYFCKPAQDVVTELLEWMISNPETTAEITTELFECTFVLFRFTDRTSTCTGGVEFVRDNSEKMIKVITNLIVNGSMEMHKLIMYWGQFLPESHKVDNNHWLKKHCGIGLYSSERNQVMTSLRAIYDRSSAGMGSFSEDMQEKLRRIDSALKLDSRERLGSGSEVESH
jgi:hypothetical protein